VPDHVGAYRAGLGDDIDHSAYRTPFLRIGIGPDIGEQTVWC